LGQGRHARVRLGLIAQQYRAIKMFETRFQNEFEREQAIYQTHLLQHPNILGRHVRSTCTSTIVLSYFFLSFLSCSAFFGADFFAKGTDTCHMLIFEWHPAGTLDDVLNENQKIQKRITIEQLMQYSISLADGLTHLHAIKYGTHGKINDTNLLNFYLK
jgi:hypothetical protein